MTLFLFHLLIPLVILVKFLEFIGIARISKDPNTWIPLPSWVLSIGCGLTAFMQPHQVFWWNGRKPASKDSNGPGAENKLLFVANHQLSAFDIPLAMSITFLEAGIFTRALADKLHFAIPIWRNIGWIWGAFEASKESCALAMKGACPILVFPGGSNEVWRSSRHEPYSLRWGDRKGFAQLAIENQYTIIPMSCIGMEDMWTRIYDIPASPFFYLMGDKKRAKQGETIPLLFPSFKFQKQYFYFSEPVETAGLDMDDPQVVVEVRNETKRRIEEGIKLLFAIRDQDPHRFISFSDYVFGKRHYLHMDMSSASADPDVVQTKVK